MYRPDMQVFEGRRARLDGGFVLRVVVTLWVGADLVYTVARCGTLQIVFVSVLAVLVGLWWWDWLRRRRPCYVVLTPTEVIFRDRGGERVRVQLADVWSAEYASLSKEVHLRDRDGQCLEAIPDLAARDYAGIAALCAAINERAGQARG